ncbi:alpha/beta hydrolase [Kordiimonas sp.]|uniref:alpha/beta hydrolase n=1 Tax=Kordiimonas sp. TaxID=1970157 RepID=UPI003A941E8E
MKKIIKITGIALGVIVAIPIAVGLTLKLTARNIPAPGEMFDVGGYSLHIHCTGQKTDLPTVVVETGSGEASSLFHWIQAGVAKTTRVCTYDRPGIGWSEESGLPRDAKNINEALHTLLDKAGIKKPFVFVGHSVAGLYNRDYIERYPEDVSGLVLLDPSHPGQGAAMGIDNAKFLPGLEAQLKPLRLLIATGYVELFNPLEQGVEHTPIAEYPSDIQDQLTYLGKQGKTYTAFLAEFRDFELAAKQADANKTLGDMPFTIISAGKPQSGEGWPDEINPERITRILQGLHTEMEGLSTNSKRVTIPGADHMSLIIERKYAEVTIPHIRDVVLQVAERSQKND